MSEQEKVDLSVEIGDIRMSNPVMTASGTAGASGRELSEVLEIGRLGAFVVKGVSLEPRTGNPVPRIVETSSGMLNAIGLQNPGVDAFLRDDLPFIRAFGVPVIVNIFGSTEEEYCRLAQRLEGAEGVAGIELNISCPNVKRGGMVFGTDPEAAARLVDEVRRATKQTLIVKLSPNVTDIAAIAKVAEEAGADSISLINTLLGMAIDSSTRRPRLANITGGLSGPAIKPVALRMVWEVCKAVSVPVIGIGGIETAADALEFIIAGASAVQVGTALFVDPLAPVRIIDGMRDYCDAHRIRGLGELRGSLVLS